jgi:hypothetical protein
MPTENSLLIDAIQLLERYGYVMVPKERVRWFDVSALVPDVSALVPDVEVDLFAADEFEKIKAYHLQRMAIYIAEELAKEGAFIDLEQHNAEEGFHQLRRSLRVILPPLKGEKP